MKSLKALSMFALAGILAATPLISSSADTKFLKNVGGTVTFGQTQNPTTPLARNATQALNDSDWAATGGSNSLATVTLPDSSVVTMAQQTQVQMQKFDQIEGSHAEFYVIGKVRFDVKHPAGAKANYQFQTATGQIAVRGTVGDIFAQEGAGGQPAGLQVNVYQLGDPSLPVQVTLKNGQTFTLGAGQSLVVTSAAGALVGSVGAVSNTTFAPFSQLGAPVNASSFGITATTTATAGTTAAAATAGVAGTTAAAVAVGAAAVGAVAASSNSGGSSGPAPSPSPTSTSVPIVISGHTPAPPAPPAPAPPAPGPTPHPPLPGLTPNPANPFPPHPGKTPPPQL